MEKICVAARVRPTVSEVSSNGSYWKVDDNRISLHKIHGTPISGTSYTFDHVFDESCTNARVYELLTRDIISAAVDGFNGTAFAYGQTSSGKTFTMNGSESDPGIIHRAVKDVFEKIQMIPEREFLIRVSYMEIYNEEINDLLASENKKLQIHESLERGIFVAGLKEEIVNNAEQVLKLIELGEVNRHFGETNMNIRSSRSHTIFRMVIESKGKGAGSLGDYSGTDAIRVSVLNLVDLAGSERIAKTGAGGVRLKEGRHINKSLMALGNVINKLSDGARQRSHIPYRDSKLTRILQPALGGNAKTSIICTIAPEEVHVEETKGTLQFASRAKRITNCVQLNEILTDAALLKRQKMEIEELRRKLQGSHAEVLEQEILKLRNDLLKYELEREKLEMELEEERKSHKESDQCSGHFNSCKLSSLATPDSSLDHDHRGEDSMAQSLRGGLDDSDNKSQGDAFRTPSFKAAPNAFVVKRSNYSSLPECSPLPDNFCTVADEDTWLKMNKGYIPDFDSLQMTPATKVESFTSRHKESGCSNEDEKQDLQSLRRELELVIWEKNELQVKHEEQICLNNRLTGLVAELHQEADLTRQLPQRLCESVTTCKNIHDSLFSRMKSFCSDGESSSAKLLSSAGEIGTTLFTTLETHFSKATDDSLLREKLEILRESLTRTIDSLITSEAASNLSAELEDAKQRSNYLEEELNSRNQLLDASVEKCSSLDKEVQQLKEEREGLRRRITELTQKLKHATELKDTALNDLNMEVRTRKTLEEGIKQSREAVARRQKLLQSLHNEMVAETRRFRAQTPVPVPNSFGC